MSKKLYAVDEPNVFGSCMDFKTRQNVTGIIKTEKLTFNAAHERYNDSTYYLFMQVGRSVSNCGVTTPSNTFPYWIRNPTCFYKRKAISDTRISGKVCS